MIEKTQQQYALKATALIGAASLWQVGLGVLRNKIAALLLGPAGVGLVGLLQSLIITVATFASAGTNTAATRQIAAQRGSGVPEDEAAVRKALLWCTALLAGTATIFVWVLRLQLASMILADASLAHEVGWCALGVGATVIGNALLALLAGVQRIADIARVNVLSGLAATLVAIAALLISGSSGLIAFVLALPFSLMFVGMFYARQIPWTAGLSPTRPEVQVQVRALITLGAGIMLGLVVSSAAQLAVRSIVGDRLGLVPLGLVQASLTISIAYLGFVLQAMGTDYYPRLSAAIHDPAAANRIVNDQAELALLLAGPAIVLLLGTAPWVLPILYSAQFTAAADILRWQLVGDALKVTAWPLGFLILASGRGGLFVALESIAATILVGGTVALAPQFGVEAPGIAYLAMYVTYLPASYAAARRLTGFTWSAQVRSDCLYLVAGAVLVSVLTHESRLTALTASMAVAMVLIYRAMHRLRFLSEPLLHHVRRNK